MKYTKEEQELIDQSSDEVKSEFEQLAKGTRRWGLARPFFLGVILAMFIAFAIL